MKTWNLPRSSPVIAPVLAPFPKRLLAILVDGAILYLLVGVITAVLILGLLGLLGAALGVVGTESFTNLFSAFGNATMTAIISFLLVALFLLLILMSVMHGYFMWFELKKEGATPGKRLFGLKVISLDAMPLTLRQVTIREFMRYIDAFLFFPGIIAVALSEKRQRLGDMWAKTIVVYSKEDEIDTLFIYLDRLTFFQLEAQIPCTIPIPAEVRNRYLAFAYPAFIFPALGFSDSHREEWLKIAGQYFPALESSQVLDETKLRFFAEGCRQKCLL